MDLSKYINALKDIPKRFGNVSYHYWDKQVSDNVAEALEEINNNLNNSYKEYSLKRLAPM